jgi:hypothetical protein
MVRIILGVVVGFIVWSVVWLGSDQVLITMSKSWYGQHQFAIEDAKLNDAPFMADSTIVIIGLVRGLIASLMAGFIAAFIAGGNRKAPLILGFLLLVVGAAVEIYYWNYLPVWYHAIFLLLLIPMTVIGGKLTSKRVAA